MRFPRPERTPCQFRVCGAPEGGWVVCNAAGVVVERFGRAEFRAAVANWVARNAAAGTPVPPPSRATRRQNRNWGVPNRVA